MRVNGHINIQIETGGGTDENGFPIPVTKTWGDPIECCFAANTSSGRGTYQDGQFTMASYTIDLETQQLPPFDTIRLTDLRGTVIGTGEEEERKLIVASIEYLDSAERIRILV